MVSKAICCSILQKSTPCFHATKNNRSNEELSRFPTKKLEVPESGSTLHQLRMMLASCWQKIESRYPRFGLQDMASIHSLPAAWGSREPQYVPPCLHYVCIMPMPLLQLQKKDAFQLPMFFSKWDALPKGDLLDMFFKGIHCRLFFGGFQASTLY